MTDVLFITPTTELKLSHESNGTICCTGYFCKFNPTTAITEKYYDKLVLNHTSKILSRGLPLGYQEKLLFITENKALFSLPPDVISPIRGALCAECLFSGLTNFSTYTKIAYIKQRRYAIWRGLTSVR